MTKKTNGKKSKSSLSNDNAQEVLALADAVGRPTVSFTQVAKDFLDIVKDPLLGGGFAMAHHGLVRATVDIDVLGIENLGPYIKTLEPLGYKHEEVSISIGRIHLLTKGDKHGIDFIDINNREFFDSIKKRAVPGIFVGQKVHFVSIEDMILLKMLAFRERKKKQDAVDLEHLMALPHDKKYLAKWKTNLRLDS